MRIVSWNINSLRKRQDRLFAWLEATGPDVVCLQETKCTDDQFPALALRAAGYYAAYHGEKSYNGVAILSKIDPRDVRPSLCDEVVDPQARVIAARKKSLATLWCAVTSTSRRKISTFTMQICGVAPSCVPMASAPCFSNYVKSACGTHCEFITRKANF